MNDEGCATVVELAAALFGLFVVTQGLIAVAIVAFSHRGWLLGSFLLVGAVLIGLKSGRFVWEWLRSL